MQAFLFRVVRVCAFMGMVFLAMGCGLGRKGLSDLPDPSDENAVITNEYPSVVKVISPGGRGLCSGTFISPRAVLTASHCLKISGSYTVFASFGTFRTSVAIPLGPGVVDDPEDIGLLIFNEDIADPSLGQVSPMGNRAIAGDTLRIVGFGCTSMETKQGSGKKRTGTNVVTRVRDYIEFITPLNNGRGARQIQGPVNRAGSCFGDSGGPAFREVEGGSLEVVGVAHAGGTDGDEAFSEYADMSRSGNQNFLNRLNQDYGLGIQGI